MEIPRFSSGIVRILKDIDYDITGKHVLLVEDLIDTGLTLTYLKDLFRAKHCASVKVCTIDDKPSRRKVNFEVDYQGIIIPDKFVVGYGLDYAENTETCLSLCFGGNVRLFFTFIMIKYFNVFFIR